MARINAALLPVLRDFDRGLRALGVPYGVIGALVPELLLDVAPPRMTNDADVVVVVGSLAAFATLKGQLGAYGFTQTWLVHRLQHRGGGMVDLLPIDESAGDRTRVELSDGVVFNMAGLDAVIPHAMPTTIDGGLTLPLAPLPLFALLKLVAFSDRQQAKDLAGVWHCLQHYAEHDDRRYGLEHAGEPVPYEFTSAYLLGLDGRRFVDAALRQPVDAVLHRFTDPDAVVVGLVAGEGGRWADDRVRIEVFESFRWYQLAVTGTSR